MDCLLKLVLALLLYDLILTVKMLNRYKSPLKINFSI